MKSTLTYLSLRLLVATLLGLLFNCSKKTPDPVIPGVTAPVLSTVTISDITPTTAKLTGAISAVGSGTATTSTISEYGLCYGLNANPTTTDTKIMAGTTASKPVDMAANLTGLKAGSAYFVRGYAIHVGGTAYSEQATFTTGNLKAPTVNSGDGFDITRSGFSVVADLVTIGTSDVTQYGHVTSETNQQPTLADTKTELGAASAPKAYRSSFANLKQNTTYYVRAYATNAGGTGYGNAVIVKTLNEVAPSVTTQGIDQVALSTARGTGTISSAGTQPITMYGHCWSSTNQNPTPADNRIDFGSTTAPKDFATPIVNLNPNTTYYVRAYATSSVGTGYGEVKTFKTLSGSAPTVETLLVPTRSFTSATLEGRVTATGTPATVSQYGHVWSSTNQNPTTADTKNQLTSAGGLSGFTSDIRNPTLNTTYYYRAYATNDAGTGYGAVKTFLTYGQAPIFKNTAGTWFNSEAEVNFGITIYAAVERFTAYGVVENDGTDKNNLADPSVDDANTFFYRGQRDLSTAEQNTLTASQYLELHLFIRKGGTDANPAGSDSGLTITNGKAAKAAFKKMRAFYIGQSGAVYYGPIWKNF